MTWTSVKDKMAPKNSKFLFKYRFGIGLGEWGQCYEDVNGNSELGKKAYILILWPSEIVAGEQPLEVNEEEMIDLEMEWKALE